MRWPARYVGLRYDRFENHGLACWGLVRRVLMEQRLIDVPEYAGVSAKDLSTIADTIRAESADPSVWREVEEYQEFDVAVMRGFMRDADGRRLRGVCHCGILTSPRTILHCDAPHDAVEVHLSHFTIRSRLVGVYRHRSLCLV